MIVAPELMISCKEAERSGVTENKAVK
jgi:hypothetical protein